MLPGVRGQECPRYNCGWEFLPMLSIRPVSKEDMRSLSDMIHEFAKFEKLSAVVSEADLIRDGFGANPKFRVLLAEWNEKLAGYALFFDYYSTFEGRAAIFLEDIYVRQEFRGKGIGKALMARVAGIAKKENCFGMRWEVLDWNTPAIDFYKNIGSTFLDAWKNVVLKDEAFEKLAEESG
jgi:GNAT superfamily N-acetyltransferase